MWTWITLPLNHSNVAYVIEHLIIVYFDLKRHLSLAVNKFRFYKIYLHLYQMPRSSIINNYILFVYYLPSIFNNKCSSGVR